jgi:Leucine-rich repeat (LRR) protein
MDFGVELEDLKISRASLSGIKAHAFKHVRGLKRLDFSENSIGSIDAEAFKDIGHSLLSLRMSHGLGSMSSLPGEAFKWLTSLQELDVSNNKLSSLSDTSFHFMKNLRMLEMHDNTIDDLKKGTFQGDIHVKLEEVSFAFNNIKQISQHTFVDLEVRGTTTTCLIGGIF